MFALRVCPHDPNKWVNPISIVSNVCIWFNFFRLSMQCHRVAIAGNNKRINILDLSTLKRDNVEIQALTSKIQGKVMALAWHPLNENLISFSTNEGRVSNLCRIVLVACSLIDSVFSSNRFHSFRLAFLIWTKIQRHPIWWKISTAKICTVCRMVSMPVRINAFYTLQTTINWWCSMKTPPNRMPINRWNSQHQSRRSAPVINILQLDLPMERSKFSRMINKRRWVFFFFRYSFEIYCKELNVFRWFVQNIN